MKPHRYIRMPAGSIVRVEDDRMVDVDHPNAVLINFAICCALAFVLGFIILALWR